MSERTNGTGWPIDLVGVAVVSVAILAVTLSPDMGLTGSALHVLFGFLFVFLVPGTALTAVLFPAAESDQADKQPRVGRTRVFNHDGGITSLERLVLSLGLSVAVVPLVGLLLNFLPMGAQLLTVVPAIAGLSLALGAIGLVRRLLLPPEERFGITLGRGVQWVTAGTSGRDRLLNVALVIGLLLATTGIAYAVIAPGPGERFTEFYLQTADNETGELVAADYPSEQGRDERTVVYVGVTNQEHRTTSYTVVAQIQRVDARGESPEVVERQRLDQFSATVEDGESWRQIHVVNPTMYGENLRVTYLLYKGDVPSNPTVENAYRTVHIWVDIG